jgi:hypothetical protein
MIHKGAQRVTKDTKGTKDHTVPKSYSIPKHTLYSREDPILLITARSVFMIVVRFTKVSALYPRLVILSPIGD